MNEDEIRQLRLGAFATTSEPLDRAAAPWGRATARRRRRAGSAAVALVGVLLGSAACGGQLENVAAYPSGQTVTPAAPSNGRAVTTPPTVQIAVSSFVNPSVSQAYTTVSPGTDEMYPSDLPPRDAPLPPTGTCPALVDPSRLPIHNPWDPTTWPKRVTAVTLCRYAQSAVDPSESTNTLTKGPVTGDLAVFTAALDKAMPAVRPIDHVGCRVVNPGPPYTVDIVFVTASGDTGKAFIMYRWVCDPPWLENPERTLDEAVDAVLGPPY